MSTTYYRMEMTYHGVRMTIRNFDRTPYETTHELTPATFNRFTAIAEKAAFESHPARTFELLRAEDGEIFFGWEIAHCNFRLCPNCQRVICEWQSEYRSGGNCFMCDFDDRARWATHDRVTGILSRPELKPEPDGDLLWT